MGNTMHDRGSSTVYSYCSPICVNPSTVGVYYTVCMSIFTYTYPLALQNQNSILDRSGLCVSENMLLNYGTSMWMIYSCNSSKKMWDVVAHAFQKNLPFRHVFATSSYLPKFLQPNEIPVKGDSM